MSVYAVSDLHGYLDNYYKIKKMLKPEDKVFCLGDCGDRGPDSWDTIKIVYQDPQFIYIKGNHEDMLVKAAREELGNSRSYQHRGVLQRNGGWGTLLEMFTEDDFEKWIDKIDKLPLYTTYKNEKEETLFLCHAGCTLDTSEIPSDEHLLWDRYHYLDNAKWQIYGIVVHGHTPIQHLADEIGDKATGESAYIYCKKKKVCIDAYTHKTGNTILFNLDTFESILIQ